MTLAAGCSMFSPAPAQKLTGAKTVCILYDETAFKNRVVEAVSNRLAAQGYAVVTDRNGRAPYYQASEYGAVVFLAEYWAWHVPYQQKRYFQGNGEAANIVFVVTSGDPGVEITEPFDAITSASGNDRIEPVAGEILTRLERILKESAGTGARNP